MLQTFDQYHNNLKNENLKAAPNKLLFLLNSVKFLGNQIQNNHIHPLKSRNFKITTIEKKKIKTKSDFLRSFQNTILTYKLF